MITDIELISIKCGDYNWMCCIPTDKAGALHEFITNHTVADFEAILRWCHCHTGAATNGSGNGGNTAPPNVVPPATITSLTAAIGSLTLPDSCGEMKDFICGKVVGLIIHGLCGLVNDVSLVSSAAQDTTGGNNPNTVYKGFLALVKFLCALYDLACQDDTAAAGFVLGWCVIGDAIARNVASFTALATGQPAIGFFINDVLTRMQNALSQTDCCPNMLTNNPQVVQLMQQMIG